MVETTDAAYGCSPHLTIYLNACLYASAGNFTALAVIRRAA